MTPQKWLYWPTRYPVITQKFMVRPEYYSRFGLPGHEGLDTKALDGSAIISCADNGLVSEVGFRYGNKKHPYGYAIRVRHERPDGVYEILYAHGSENSSLVEQGQSVNAGDVLMRASKNNLHISLKKIAGKKDKILPPKGLEPIDYFYLSNGHILMNPLVFMWPIDIKPPNNDNLDRFLLNR